MDNNLPNPPPVDRSNNNVSDLQTDIQCKNYNDNLRFEVEQKPICDEMLHWFLHDEKAHRLNMPPSIVETMDNLLQCKRSIKYLCDNDAEIKRCYEDHYIRNKKNFELMDELDSFVLSILMYKYH